MYMQYSLELIEECKKIFKEDYSLNLSSETANKYLESMAKVFFCVSKSDTEIEPIKEEEVID